MRILPLLACLALTAATSAQESTSPEASGATSPRLEIDVNDAFVLVTAGLASTGAVWAVAGGGENETGTVVSLGLMPLAAGTAVYIVGNARGLQGSYLKTVTSGYLGAAIGGVLLLGAVRASANSREIIAPAVLLGGALLAVSPTVGAIRGLDASLSAHLSSRGEPVPTLHLRVGL